MLLDVHQLSASQGRQPILTAVSFSLPPGQLLALVGPNGAGKTTILNCISGFVRPDSGDIRFKNISLLKYEPHQRTRLGIGRTIQDSYLLDALPVFDYLLLGQHTSSNRHLWLDPLALANLRHERAARQRAWATLHTLALAEAATAPLSTLSRGQRKRLDVARCFLQGGQLLLLDEPASGLQEHDVHALADTITTLRQQTPQLSVLMVEHHLGMVKRTSDAIILLDRGQVLLQGTIDEVAADPVARAIYFGQD